MAILRGRLVLTNRYFLCNIPVFLIIQLSIQQSDEHSFLAQFREYTCVFFLMLKFETFQSSRVVQHTYELNLSPFAYNYKTFTSLSAVIGLPCNTAPYCTVN